MTMENYISELSNLPQSNSKFIMFKNSHYKHLLGKMLADLKDLGIGVIQPTVWLRRILDEIQNSSCSEIAHSTSC